MTGEQFEIALGRLRVVGSACYGFLCREDIDAVAKRIDPQVDAETLEALEKACAERHQVVSAEEKAEILEQQRRRMEEEAEARRVQRENQFVPEQGEFGEFEEFMEKNFKPLPDPALIDRVLNILMNREIKPEMRKLWLAELEKDERYMAIYRRRPGSDAEAVARELGVEPVELYRLEQKMITAYYVCAQEHWRATRDEGTGCEIEGDVIV